MKNGVIFLENGFEEIEAFSVIDILRRIGINITSIGIKNNIIFGAHDIKVFADDIISNASFENIDFLVIPGGMKSTQSLMKNTEVVSIIKQFNSKNKLICAICAGPMVLSASKILKNKMITCYPSVELGLDIKKYSNNSVVIDNNIITSKGPATANEFAFEIAKFLGYSERVEKIKKDMLFR